MEIALEALEQEQDILPDTSSLEEFPPPLSPLRFMPQINSNTTEENTAIPTPTSLTGSKETANTDRTSPLPMPGTTAVNHPVAPRNETITSDNAKNGHHMRRPPDVNPYKSRNNRQPVTPGGGSLREKNDLDKPI
jgi:hypothetical protein